MELQTQNKIEQIEDTQESRNSASQNDWTPASISLELGSLCMRFARVDRVPRYDDHERESDTEHSFMLAMIAPELAHMYYPNLNKQLIGEYARVHDLIEVVTGDVATFDASPEDLANKEAEEHSALASLADQLPPYTASLLVAYEAQADNESRFVRAVDKLMPVVVDIIGQGSRVMKEDYGVSSHEELEKSHDTLHARIARKFGEFTLIVEAHRQLCDVFEAEFLAD